MHKGQKVRVPVKNRQEQVRWVEGEVVGQYQSGRWVLVAYQWGSSVIRGGWMREDVRMA